MTMPYSPSRAVYEGNDAATRFPFSFKVWDASQLVVTLTSPAGVTTGASGWTADIGASGGEIVYLHDAAPLPAGWKLAITRDMPFTQEVNLVSASRFDPQVIEDALDQAAAERQQTMEMMRRAVILPATSDKTPQDVVQDVYASRDASVASAIHSKNAAEESATQANKSEAEAHRAASEADRAGAEANRSKSEANRAESAAEVAADKAHEAMASELARAASEADRARAEADRAQNMSNIGPATVDKLGFVKIGEGIAAEDNGTISVTPVDFASSEKPGTVKPGLGLTIADGGALNVSYWDAFPPCVPVPVWGVTFGGSDGRRAIMPGETQAREDWIKCDGGTDGISGVVPNLTGRVLLGTDTANPAGALAGTSKHTHTITGNVDATTISTAQMPSHGHYYTYPPHYGQENQASGGSAGRLFNSLVGGTTGAQGDSGGHIHSMSNALASNTSNMMPYFAMDFVIKVV
ncbi:hypothetical protein [Desulfovibrio intestinalis]|uniref:Tail fiber protein n=1 Tax=Desulfovibrio intestinalis TaxID=58621 RepID=A0A7W8C0C4_9BACT|nr:hypothetical protein [Desulfovibrio intestinalis]MBB5143243.1 hypothetical protein [Desulfovibrio intestinalis]